MNFQSSQKRAFDPDAREFVILKREYDMSDRFKDGQEKRRDRRQAERQYAKKSTPLLKS